MEEEIDKILSQYNFDIPLDNIELQSALSSALVSDDPIPLALTQTSQPHPLPAAVPAASSSMRFAELKTDSNVQHVMDSSVPKNTKKSTD